MEEKNTNAIVDNKVDVAAEKESTKVDAAVQAKEDAAAKKLHDEKMKNFALRIEDAGKLLSDPCISLFRPIRKRDATRFYQNEVTSPKVREQVIKNWINLGVDNFIVAAFSIEDAKVRETFLKMITEDAKKDAIKKLKLYKKVGDATEESFEFICTPKEGEKNEKLQTSMDVTKFWCGVDGVKNSLEYLKELMNSVDLNILALAIVSRIDSEK